MKPYKIAVDCRLTDRMVRWLGGELSVYNPLETSTFISRPLDKTGLYGLLARLRDLNIGIVSVKRIETRSKGEEE